jgi:uncharacterized UPF0160 family protein
MVILSEVIKSINIEFDQADEKKKDQQFCYGLREKKGFLNKSDDLSQNNTRFAENITHSILSAPLGA